MSSSLNSDPSMKQPFAGKHILQAPAAHFDFSKKAIESPKIDEAALRNQVSNAAYFMAEQRGFEPGFELQDWLSAEAQLSEHVVCD